MIQLRRMKYAQFEGAPQEWFLDNVLLNRENLIVGKNASGKSRTLSVINSLAMIVCGVMDIPLSGNYDVEYLWDDHIINYQLKYENQKVILEKFSRDNDVLLERGEGGKGTIFAEALGTDGTFVDFQTPPDKVAVVARQDNIQHKFLEPLYAWGSSLRLYQFGSSLGKDSLAVMAEKRDNKAFNERDPYQIIHLYREAIDRFGDKFKQAVIQDMQTIGYDLDNIGIGDPVSLTITNNSLGDLVCLFVKENDLPGITDQPSMSSGMFRAFSLLIHINYSQMAQTSTCVLVDDIGEGLDFDRSCLLIDLLLKKTNLSQTQLILSTNDRFVMDRVPLRVWSVLQRKGNRVHVLNYENSKELFEEFKFTGLSNFSFLEMDFANDAPSITDNGKSI